MSLDSQAYFFFLAIVCGLYFQIKPGFRWALLLGASYLFYFIANPGAFFLIPATTLISYVAARMMGRARWRERRPWILGAAIFWVLGTLIFYKYADVVIEPLNHWLAPGGFSLPVLKYFYPLGLAFYSLQVIGYLIDVYRETLEPERHVGIYALFVCFFPSLIAGPIERAPHLLPQLRLLPGFDRERWRSGLLLILSGLFKKIVLADFFAQLVVPVFEQPKSFSGGMLLLATVVSRYRLYFDFSGYTDMARGSARLFGVDLLRNFNHPFRALSIADFWRRWHMSLSSWMRDYVYYPLITSPARKLGLYVNIIITFTILGLWHAGTACFFTFRLRPRRVDRAARPDREIAPALERLRRSRQASAAPHSAPDRDDLFLFRLPSDGSFQ